MSSLFDTLGREQSAGEAHARLLHRHLRAIPADYARGILLYTEAKAAFDGLIEEAKHHLTEGTPLDQVPGFPARVQAAVDHRTAFTDFVRDQVMVLTANTREGLGDLLSPKDLIEAVFNGLLALWRELRAADAARRAQTLSQLDALKWRPFEALAQD
jgi:hypothetical protein